MSNQGIKPYGTYFNTSISDGSSIYINLSKSFDNLHYVIPLYNSSYKLSPINLSLIFTSSNNNIDYYFQTGFKLSIIKELAYDSQNSKYMVTNADMSIEEYKSQNNYKNSELASYMVIENNQFKIVYIDSVYTFNSSYKLILIEDRSNTINKIHFSYDQGHIDEIYNNYGETIEFHKYSTYVRLTIEKSGSTVYNTYIYYSDDYINRIDYNVYNNNTNNLVNQLQIETDVCYQIHNTFTKETILILRPSSSKYKVYEGRGTNEDTLDYTIINLINNYHTIVSYHNMHTHYYFNDNYLINHIIDANKYIVGITFDGRKNITFKSNVFKNNYLHQDEIYNLISDGFCQGNTPPWTYSDATISYINNTDANYYYNNEYVTSSKLLKIQNPQQSSAISTTYQLINVGGTPLDTYTFRCITKCEVAGISASVRIILLKDGNTLKTYSKTLSNDTSYKELFVFEINPEVSFDQIKVLFFIKGTNATYTFDSICLTKQIAGVTYSYDNNNNITNKTIGKNETKYLINENNKVISSSGKYNVAHFNYNYIATRDNDLVSDDLLERKNGLFGTCLHYDYNSCNQVTNESKYTPKYDGTISHDKALYLNKQYTYETNNEFVSSEKIEDKEIEYTSNGTKHFLLKRKKLPNGTRYHYGYNEINSLTCFGINQSNIEPALYDSTIDYNSSNLEVDQYLDKRFNKIKFTYNNDNRLSNVKIFDANNNYKKLVDIKYANESQSNLPHLSLIESKEYGDDGDKYTFEYDNKYNLSLIKFRKQGTVIDSTKFSITYDDYNRLSSITKNVNANTQITKSIYYDKKDRVNKIIEGNNIYNLKYDNEEAFNYLYNQEQNQKTYQSFINSNKCNERSPEKFYNFVKTLNLNNSNYNCYSCFFDDWDFATQGIDRKTDLTCIDENGEISLGAADTYANNSAKIVRLILNRLNYDISSLNTKTIITYFNGSASGTLLSIVTNNNDAIEIYKNTTGLQVEKNGTALGSTIVINFAYNKAYVLALVIDGTALYVLINDKHYFRALNATSFTNLKYGKTNLSSQGSIKLNGIIVTSINDLDFIKLMSKEGYNALYESVYDKGNFCAASVEETILIDEDLTNDFTVFPLNNSFEAINENNNIKLLEYTKRSNSLDSDDFIFNNKNDKYSLLLDYNKVIYKTNLTDEGTILVNFTVSDYSLYPLEKVLLRLYNDNTEISLLIENDKELSLKINNETYDLGIYINNNFFNRIGFSYKYTSSGTFSYRIKLNQSTVDSSKSVTLNLNNSLNLQLGNNSALTMPLNGYLETLCINDSFNTLTYLSNYIGKINISNYLTAYDELGRIKGKKVRVDLNEPDHYQYITIGYNKYEYEEDEDDSSNLTTRIKSESFNLGEQNSFVHDYTYDNNGRLTGISNGDNALKEYAYDIKDQITRDKNYYNGIYKQNQYSYDDSGNITQKIKSGSNITTETLTYEYGYVNNDNHTINKNALVRIKNGNTIVESITYDDYMNSLPVSITKNNITTSLTWEGMKLKSYGNISYDYDYLGRRISKVITNGKSYKYNYDIRGNMVSEEITSNNVTTIIRYLYDVNNNVYGLIYNGNIYYYVKNILGEILYIIDKYGDVRVEYNYDAFGNILSISGNMSTTLGNNNHIVYKSYYIDFENDLYYLKARFYNPSWGRFISSDKIEFLDPSVASGLNLYAYCLNNPVMHDDPEGTFIGIGIALLILAVIAVDTVVETVILMTSDKYKAENVFDGTSVSIPNSAFFNNPIAQLIYSNYLYDNVKTEEGERFFTGDAYDIVGEWAAHNFASMITGSALTLISGLPDNSIKTLLFKHTYNLHRRSVHLDLGTNIEANDSVIVSAVSYAFKELYRKLTFYVLYW